MKREHIYPLICLGIFLVVLVFTGITPAIPKEWSLNMWPAIITVAIIIFLYFKDFRFSNTSYTLILIFLVLHMIASYYSYSEIPLGDMIRSFLGLSRNPYDRIVHFSFGLFWYLPIFELYQKLTNGKKNRVFDYFIPLMAIIAAGSVYEIGEWMSTMFVDFNISSYFIGAQGDAWDSQRDMLCNSLGGTVSMVIFYIVRRIRG